jgi:hypothetical protein
MFIVISTYHILSIVRKESTRLIHKYIYIVGLFDTGSGVIGVVHDNQQFPLIDASGLHLVPGRNNRITYAKKTTSFLSSQYTTCSVNIPRVFRQAYNNYPNADYMYSQETCYFQSIQAFTYVLLEAICNYSHVKHIFIIDTSFDMNTRQKSIVYPSIYTLLSMLIHCVIQ